MKFASYFLASLVTLSTATASFAAEMIITSETAPSHWKSLQMDALAKDITERSEGRIQAKTYHTTLFKGDKEAVEALGSGAVHMVWPASDRLEAVNPAYAVLGVPFTFKAAQMGKAETQGELTQLMSELVESRGIQILGIARATEAIFLSREKVEALADLSGKKIRVPGSVSAREMMAALGANGISLPASELATSLSQGAIDMAFTSAGQWPGMGTSVTKYGFQVADMHLGTYSIAVDKAWLEGLSEQDRAAVVSATSDLMSRQWNDAAKNEAEAITRMTSQGGEIVRLEGDATEPFRTALEPMRQKYLADYADLAKKVQATMAH